MVSGRNIVDTKDLTGRNMAEHGDFLHSGCKKLLCASTGNQVGEKAQTSEVSHTGLGRLCLLFAADDGDEGDVDKSKVFVADSELKLTHGLDERHRFNITNGTTELVAISKTHKEHSHENSHLDDTDVRFLSGLVHRDLGNSLDPVLDGVGQMRDNLNSFSQVISPSLNHISINIYFPSS